MGDTSSSDMETGEQLCPGKTICGHWNLDFMSFSPPTEEYFPECFKNVKVILSVPALAPCVPWHQVLLV